MSEQKDKRCSECGYFVKHYAYYKGRLTSVRCCGHCKNRNVDIRTSKKLIRSDSSCDYWICAEDDSDERKRVFKDIIKNMHERLEEMAELLKTD